MNVAVVRRVCGGQRDGPPSGDGGAWNSIGLTGGTAHPVSIGGGARSTAIRESIETKWDGASGNGNEGMPACLARRGRKTTPGERTYSGLATRRSCHSPGTPLKR